MALKRISLSDLGDAVRLLISLSWAALAVIAAVTFFPLIGDAIRTGAISKLAVGGLEVDFFQRQLSRIVALDRVPMTDAEKKTITARFLQLSDQIKGTSILWVDDNNPYQAGAIKAVLEAAGVNVDLAVSTAEAFRWMHYSKYDVVITDLDRKNDLGQNPPEPCYNSNTAPTNAGCYFLKIAGAEPYHPFLIVYAGAIKTNLGMPPNAFAMTNHTYDLFNDILNAIISKAPS